MLFRVGTKREIMKISKQRQLRFFGNVMRLQQQENVCVTGKVEGRRGRGGPRVKLVDSLAKSCWWRNHTSAAIAEDPQKI